MKCIVRNCNDKQLKKHIKQAVNFYADRLMHKNFSNTLTITVRFDESLGTQYYAKVFPTDYFDPPHKKFLMQLNCDLKKPLLAIAHEMVHVRQYAKGELDTYHKTWKKSRVKKGLDYLELPWEKEAMRYEYRLYSEYKKKFNYFPKTTKV